MTTTTAFRLMCLADLLVGSCMGHCGTGADIVRSVLTLWASRTNNPRFDSGAVMVEVQGFCDERFIPIRELFGAGLERGSDEGASYAVSMNGRCVVDLWGGYRDLEHAKRWETD